MKIPIYFIYPDCLIIGDDIHDISRAETFTILGIERRDQMVICTFIENEEEYHFNLIEPIGKNYVVIRQII